MHFCALPPRARTSRSSRTAGRGVLDALEPTPKGTGHLGAIDSEKFVQLRFPVPQEGGLELLLGNVVALSGAGASYQLELRRDGPEGTVVHVGKEHTGTPVQAEKHVRGRAWNEHNREPIPITSHLTDADRQAGHIDIFVTAHAKGDRWTLYRDDNASPRWDLRAQAPAPNAEQARKLAWQRLETFVKDNARAGILNAAPRYVLKRCKQLVSAGR